MFSELGRVDPQSGAEVTKCVDGDSRRAAPAFAFLQGQAPIELWQTVYRNSPESIHIEKNIV